MAMSSLVVDCFCCSKEFWVEELEADCETDQGSICSLRMTYEGDAYYKMSLVCFCVVVQLFLIVH